MRSRRVWPLIIFIILVGIVLLLLNLESKQDKAIQVLPAVPQTISVRQTATVSRVVDGDTIKVMIQGKEDTVRLIGMDAPETVNPEKTTQCFGKESSDKAREILIGKSIILESDSTQGDKDEYGRLLRYIFLLDGTDFDEFMISEGYAYEYTFKNSPYKYRHEFIQAQKKAKKERKGLWGSC